MSFSNELKKEFVGQDEEFDMYDERYLDYMMPYTEYDLNTPHEKTDDVWDSGIVIIPNTIVIDEQVLDIARALQKTVGRKEFSVLFKGWWREDGFFVSDEYYVPEQTVGAAEVNYDEDISIKRGDGFNTVVHSHPFPSNNFSGADDEHINSHFDCSLLFSSNEFVCATTVITLNDESKVMTDYDSDGIEIEDSREIVIEGIDRIKEKKWVSPKVIKAKRSGAVGPIRHDDFVR